MSIRGPKRKFEFTSKNTKGKKDNKKTFNKKKNLGTPS